MTTEDRPTPKLIVHIGDCKSGSTAIQSVLQRGSYRYIEPGAPSLRYALGGRRKGLNHHRLSNSLHLENHAKIKDEAWGRFAEEVAACKDDLIVISSERFEFCDPAIVANQLRKVLPEHIHRTMRVIAYVRPHAQRLLSGYAQQVRQGLFEGSLEAFLDHVTDEARFAFAPRLERWQAAFGQALTLRVMDRTSLEGACVVHDFLAFCAEKRATPRVDLIPTANTSLNPFGLATMRALSAELKRRNPAPNAERQALLQHLATQLEDTDGFGTGSLRVPARLADRVDAAFAEDAATCDRLFFDGTPLTQSLATIVAAARSSDASVMPEPDAPEILRHRDMAIAWMEILRMQQRAQQAAARKANGPSGRRHVQ
ncbi:hypothetical protein JANAI62_00540 [Jannaschia pagri]|uniref:Sulfotransferase family protein n=1 Tax=Jannaschia pagri TaxID=2829797 RepID=A0ABQ4NG77_9RHOB|nr:MULTISPECIES: hypothetical protein [unclassified Jannaschia]GIT90464.1 hypothetical protein JANAI61_09220 [Jannaschia sp. AI_61]GIT93431.1 hypothetical protein JANAI62_00540 [Jannaschia sp. AI_62]